MIEPAREQTDAPRPALARAWDSGLALIAVVTLARLAYLLWVCPYTLIEDEAHYWEWSRRPELSYYSKGPGVAWVIRTATELCGTHEWSVRLPAALFGAFGAWCAAGLARDACNDRRAGLYGAAIYLCMPAFWVLGLLMTIDGPYLACWAAASWAGWRAMRSGSLRAWAALGLALGAGFIFKYTILLLVPGLAIAWCLARREGRRPVSRRGLVLAALLAAVGLVPVLAWNAQHGWVTVRHLLGHLAVEGGDVAHSEGWSPFWVIELLGAQLALAGPAVVLAIFAAERAWRDCAAEPQNWCAARFLVCCAAPVLVFYIAVALIAEPEGNWPLGAWVTAAPLGAIGVAGAMPRHRDRIAAWRERGCAGIRPRMGRVVAWRCTLAVGVLVALGFARADLLARLPVVGPLIPRGRLMLADTRARDAARILDELRERTGREPFLVAQHYGRASQLAYYLRGERTVYSASAHTGGRTTQYDVWPETDLSSDALNTELAGRPALLVGGEPHHWEPAFDRVEEHGQLEGEHKQGRRIYLGYVFRGFGRRGAEGSAEE